MALEGKELDVKLGEYGSAFVDVNDNLEVEVGLSAKVDIVKELEKLAAKTKTPYDDKAVAAIQWVKDLLKKNAGQA